LFFLKSEPLFPNWHIFEIIRTWNKRGCDKGVDIFLAIEKIPWNFDMELKTVHHFLVFPDRNEILRKYEK